MFNEEEIAKLPKWAKDRINSLLLKVSELTERVSTLEQFGVDKDTLQYGVSYHNNPFEEVRYYLPKHSSLVAELPCGFKVESRSDIDGKFIRIDIADGVIVPQARNVIAVYPTHDKKTRKQIYIPY
jgi:hypothetical protein